MRIIYISHPITHSVTHSVTSSGSFSTCSLHRSWLSVPFGEQCFFERTRQVWFQNRRMKHKRQTVSKDETDIKSPNTKSESG